MTTNNTEIPADPGKRYRAFATEQAAGISASLGAWAEAVAEYEDLQAIIATLPADKQQPNLVFAAARWHGAQPGSVASLREHLTTHWRAVKSTILSRATQTNEAARCSAILLGLQHIPGPIALLEVGASAGLCLIPDRYSYKFGDDRRLDPENGPSPVVIDIDLRGNLQAPTRMPRVTWRAGLDANPLDPADPDTLTWLETLVWPEQEARRARLRAAASLASRHDVMIWRGDLRTDLDALVAAAPDDATLVVTHSATLAYLDKQDREDVVTHIERLGAHRISYEGRGADPAVPLIDDPLTPDTLFVAALDGRPYALGDGHATTLTRPRQAPDLPDA